jgi:hypothetical protein
MGRWGMAKMNLGIEEGADAPDPQAAPAPANDNRAKGLSDPKVLDATELLAKKSPSHVKKALPGIASELGVEVEWLGDQIDQARADDKFIAKAREAAAVAALSPTDAGVLAAIQQAAQLTDIEYETQRTDIAKELNVRVKWLDEQVKKARPKAAKPKPESKGRIKPYKLDDMGNIISGSQGNIKAALVNLGVDVRYDLLKETTLVDGKPITDAIVDDLWLRIDKEEKFRPQRELFDIVLGAAAREKSFHPVLDYLNSLKWDRKPRLGKLFHVYFNAENTEFNSKVGSCLMITAVRRVKKPGTKWDELPILENQQGQRKSTGLRNLVGNED